MISLIDSFPSGVNTRSIDSFQSGSTCVVIFFAIDSFPSGVNTMTDKHKLLTVLMDLTSKVTFSEIFLKIMCYQDITRVPKVNGVNQAPIHTDLHRYVCWCVDRSISEVHRCSSKCIGQIFQSTLTICCICLRSSGDPTRREWANRTLNI